MKLHITRKIGGWVKGIIYKVYLGYCQWRFGEDIRVIPLTKLKFTVVYAKDYARLNKYKWHARYRGNSWYAARSARVGEINDGRPVVWMHRMIKRAPEGKVVDHRNHKGLDNRRENLRLATQGENALNRRKTKSACTSRFKGVIFRKETGRWRFSNLVKKGGLSWWLVRKLKVRRKHWCAEISIRGRKISLGYYRTEVEAARAYDAAAKKYHGRFASLNFPKKQVSRQTEVKNILAFVISWLNNLCCAFVKSIDDRE